LRFAKQRRNSLYIKGTPTAILLRLFLLYKFMPLSLSPPKNKVFHVNFHITSRAECCSQL
jgi:hypothetical protein